MKDMPVTMSEPDGWMEKTGGYAKDMTLRDYYAAQVLTAVMSNVEMFKSMSEGVRGPTDELVNGCYTIAEKMIKARS